MDLETAQAAKQRLETDNLALYSKIRYLQSYGGSGGANGTGGPMYKSPQVSSDQLFNDYSSGVFIGRCSIISPL